MSTLYGTERVAQIRAKLKEKYPYIKFSITKDGYNGVNIRILEAPIDFSDKENQQAKAALKDIEDIASEGVTYRETGDYGNQPDFYVWVRVGTWDKPFVYKPSASPTTSVGGTRKPFTRGASTTNYDRGMLVFECDSGWKVYKKRLPDNRVVYNAIKDKDVAANKEDWNAIKGEVYIEAGFKWGRFGAFERWGEIDDSVESNVLNDLCAVFSKYYKKTAQTQTQQEVSSPTTASNQYDSNKFIYGLNSAWGVPQDNGQLLINELTSDEPANISFVDYSASIEYKHQFTFELEYERRTIIYIKEKTLDYSFYVSDRGGTFNIGRITQFDPDNTYTNRDTVYYTNVAYIFRNSPKSIIELKEDIVNAIFDGLRNEKLLRAKPIGGENTAYQNVPPNPKLEYCKILYAEGYEEYTSRLPKTFNSFTALTKFIADNIGEITESGYDKHAVAWKWNFDDTEYTQRWDIGQSLNPNIFTNLWAYTFLQNICFLAWQIGRNDYVIEINESIKEIGKDGFELSGEQFYAIIENLIAYYPYDESRFEYNSLDSRWKAFLEAYPAILNIFTEPQPTTQTELSPSQIEEAENLIEALEILLEGGYNEEAQNLLDSLRILLS